MKKLLQFVDDNILKFGIAFLILFIALYPKLPSVHIIRTWVYIRLEDFFILGVVVIWFIDVLRRKVRLPWKLGSPIALYWLAGLLSFVFSLIFIAPTLTNFFPHVAALNYIRRIEYMILFFVAFSTIRTKKDIKQYVWIISITVLLFTLYGFGQRLYLTVWNYFPQFFEKNQFCFPSFQTGNEEFAKGIPLCLPGDARITSTFGGHYDLAAYLVVVLSLFVGILVSLKRWAARIGMFMLYLASLSLLMLTSSRVSFIAYIVGATATLILYKKKRYILPMLVISVITLLIFSGSTARRLLSTFRFANIVTNSQGQLIGESTNGLPDSLKQKLAHDKQVTESINPQDLQQGSGYLGLPQKATPVATNVAVIKKTISPEEARRLRLADTSLQISTVSGTFLVRRVLVYDISFTTRFQGEWPHAWSAFLRDPLFGSGYATITLATDNDYLRALGESGAFGLLSFALIFVVFGIAFKNIMPQVEDRFTRGVLWGLAGGTIGLFVNATLIDVFEASKVAESFWIFMGLGMGTLLLYKKEKIPYKESLLRLFTSPVSLVIYLTTLLASFFMQSIGNFFVADDFTWLKWAATSTTGSVPRYFTNAQHFFYRPLDKTVVYLLYTLFSFQPEGYHLFILFIHLLISLGVYVLTRQIFHKKWVSFIAAVLFLLLPAHAENLFWFSTLSTVISAFFIIYALIMYLVFSRLAKWYWYAASFVFVLLAFASYEIAVIAPLLILATDFFLAKKRKPLVSLLYSLPFLALIPLYGVVRVVTHAFISGGDYSYNAVKFLPNLVGNFLGYIAFFFAGEPALSGYNGAREALRGVWLPVTVVLLLLVIFLAVVIYLKRKAVISCLRSELGSVSAYGVVFAFISLLPFLGLGNMSGRYLYLASTGFLISLMCLGIYLYEKIHLQPVWKKTAVVVLVVAVAAVYHVQLNVASRQWQRAGELTNRPLRLFRVYYENLNASDHLYFVNTPVRYKDTWVYPLGLTDALWFIYRDGLPQIREVGSISEAQAEARLYDAKSVYIFRFDSKGVMHRVQ